MYTVERQLKNVVGMPIFEVVGYQSKYTLLLANADQAKKEAGEAQDRGGSAYEDSIKELEKLRPVKLLFSVTGNGA